MGMQTGVKKLNCYFMSFVSQPPYYF